MRIKLPLGSWEPDWGELGSDYLEDATNVLPRVGYYSPFPDLQAISTSALAGGEICRGIWHVRNSVGIYKTIVATPTKLYVYNPDTFTFTDVSGAVYNLPTEDFWSGVQYGLNFYVTNNVDGLQVIDVDTLTAFAAAGGSPPAARGVTVMDDKLVLWSLASNPQEIAWSDIDDPEEWVTGSAGGQVFPDHGEVMGFLPHARLVLMERGLRSINSTGDITSFEFPELAFENGCIAPWSVVERGTIAAWLSTEGIYAGSASSGFANITINRCSRYILDNIVFDRRHQVFGAYDPFSPRMFWAWPTQDTAYNNRILVWDPSLPSQLGQGQFSNLEVNTYVISRLATSGLSLEGLDAVMPDMDLATLSLDSFVWRAGAPILCGVGTDLKLSAFEGGNLAARITTKSLWLGEPGRARVQNIMPLVSGTDSDDITVSIKTRAKQSDDFTTSSAIAQQSDTPWHPANHDSRFHAFQFDEAAGKTWDKFQGFYVEYTPTSLR